MFEKRGNSIKEIANRMRKEEFLEFKDEFKEKYKVRLREVPLGEPPSYTEIQRYLKVKERLAKLLKEKKEQQGLIYRLHLKKRNSHIDEEIQETGDEYSELLSQIRKKTGFSNEEVEEYIEGGRVKKIENYIIRVRKNNEEIKEDLSPGKKQIFSVFRSLAREKKINSLVGVALIGTSIVAPPTGFVSMIIFGLHPGFLPFTLGPAAKAIKAAGGAFLLRGALKERKDRSLRTINVGFNEKLQDFEGVSNEELELRNTKISMPEAEPQKIVEIKKPIIVKEKREEEPIKEKIKKGKEELLKKLILENEFVNRQKPVKTLEEKIPEPVKKEQEQLIIESVKEEPLTNEELELRNTKISMPEVEPKQEPIKEKDVSQEIKLEDKKLKEEPKDITIEDFGSIKSLEKEKVPEPAKEKVKIDKKEELFMKLGGENSTGEEVVKENYKDIKVKSQNKEKKDKNIYERKDFVDSKEIEQELLTGKPIED